MSEPFKLAVNRRGMSPETLKAFDALSEEEKQKYGAAHHIQCEAVPSFAIFPHEKSIDNAENYQNSRILFTRDRPGGILSGYGGRGDTQCSTIDIVTGYQSYKAVVVNDAGEELLINPDFGRDAARIYISQKTDIDKNFVIAPQENSLAYQGQNAREGHFQTKPSSAIGIKADSVRIIARETIRLVTHTDSENSQGGKIHSTGGIELIAGNIANSLQPIVLGDYLTDALKQVVWHIDKLNGIVNTFAVEQKAFNDKVTNHSHLSPFYKAPTDPSLPVRSQGARNTTEMQNSVLDGLKNHKDSIATFQSNYLELQGSMYINSRFNSCN